MRPTKLFILIAVLVAAMLVNISITSAQSRAKSSAAASEVKAEATGEPQQTQSYIAWFLHSSGVIGLFILGLALYMVFLVIRANGSLQSQVAAPPDQLAGIEALIEQDDHKGVIRFVRSHDSFLCRVLSFGLVELPNGLEHARNYMERHGEAESVEMENKISMLAVLGSLGPMIGLIGTLKGMIASFSVIATSESQLRASAVAGGISEALLLTFEGVALSVPAIYFFAVFRNRVSSISVGTMLKADSLLLQFANTVRQRSTASSTVSKSAAA